MVWRPLARIIHERDWVMAKRESQAPKKKIELTERAQAQAG